MSFYAKVFVNFYRFTIPMHFIAIKDKTVLQYSVHITDTLEHWTIKTHIQHCNDLFLFVWLYLTCSIVELLFIRHFSWSQCVYILLLKRIIFIRFYFLMKKPHRQICHHADEEHSIVSKTFLRADVWKFLIWFSVSRIVSSTTTRVTSQKVENIIYLLIVEFNKLRGIRSVKYNLVRFNYEIESFYTNIIWW